MNPVIPEGGYLIDTTTIQVPHHDTTLSAPDTVIVDNDTTITVDTTITITDVDTVVNIVSPNPEFEVVLPNGDLAVGQTINFSLTLPGVLEQSSDVVDENGLVSPGRWIVTKVCPNPMPEVPPDEPVYCLPTQGLVASPTAGNPGLLQVNNSYPPDEPEAPVVRAARRH